MKHPLLLTAALLLALLPVAEAPSANGGFTLTVDYLYGGMTSEMNITGGAPGGLCYFLCSGIGPGPTTLASGLVLDLSFPIRVIGREKIASDGTATRWVPIPVKATGYPVWIQAAQELAPFTFQSTNLVAATIG